MHSPTLPNTRRKALITGASSGLGLAFVRVLLEEDYEVWGSSREPSRLLEHFSGDSRFHAFRLDLEDGAELDGIFARVVAEAGGGFDVVILNAGFGVFGSFAHVEFADWDAQFQAMISGTARLGHAAVRSLLARGGGTLVHVSSLAVDFPIPCLSGYNMAKAALSALSETLLLEHYRSPVHFIDFRPGDHRTEFNHSMRRPDLGLDVLPESLVWNRLVQNLREGPEARQAAEQLRDLLKKGYSGVYRSGSFFQARLAPFLARFGWASLRRRLTARYFHLL